MNAAPTVEAQLRHLEELLLQPEVRSSAERMAGLLADDLRYCVARRLKSKKPVRALRGSIWRLSNGLWQMVFHQGTLTK